MIEREEATYAVRERRSETHNGQDYALLLYDTASETNPYARGVSAFGLYGKYVVIAELTVTDAFTGNEAAMLSDFLDKCHYGKSER